MTMNAGDCFAHPHAVSRRYSPFRCVTGTGIPNCLCKGQRHAPRDDHAEGIPEARATEHVDCSSSSGTGGLTSLPTGRPRNCMGDRLDGVLSSCGGGAKCFAATGTGHRPEPRFWRSQNQWAATALDEGTIAMKLLVVSQQNRNHQMPALFLEHFDSQ